jgi:hypothetical protein
MIVLGLCAAQQWHVFIRKNNGKNRLDINFGELNRGIVHVDNVNQDKPTSNFISDKHNLIGLIISNMRYSCTDH